MQILNYKPVMKGSLMGTFSLKIDKWGGFVIREMAYFSKDGKPWVSFPSRAYEKDGVKKYSAYCLFEDQKTMALFGEQVIKALDKWFEANPHPTDNGAQQEQFPF